MSNGPREAATTTLRYGRRTMANNGTNGEVTFQEAATAYVAHIQALGKAEPTVRSYGSDLAMAGVYFGGDKAMGKFLKAHVSGFLKSEVFTTKRDGTPKAEVSLKKSRRAVRQFFEWAVSQGHMNRVPFPQE